MSDGLQANRVVEIWNAGANQICSGYLIDGAHVLTAAHGLTPAQPCEVRPLTEQQWRSATIRWHGQECDAALLRIDGRDPAALPTVRFGRLATDARCSCRAVGFPHNQERREASRLVRDTEEVVGDL